MRLKDEARFKLWLDKWNLIPSEQWQEGLEEALNQSLTRAVFIGPNDLSPWHHEEMRNALQRRLLVACAHGFESWTQLAEYFNNA